MIHRGAADGAERRAGIRQHLFAAQSARPAAGEEVEDQRAAVLVQGEFYREHQPGIACGPVTVTGTSLPWRVSRIDWIRPLPWSLRYL